LFFDGIIEFYSSKKILKIYSENSVDDPKTLNPGYVIKIDNYKDIQPEKFSRAQNQRFLITP
jgi:hypothetical protein